MDSDLHRGTLDALCAISPLAIIAVNQQNQIVLWNPAAEAIFGWSEQELLGQIPPFGTALAPALHSSNVLHTVGRKMDGGSVEIECRIAPRPAGGWIVLITDLTDKMASERERDELLARDRDAAARIKAESRFRELLEAAPDAIIEVDRDGRILLLNAVTVKLFGYEREELLGRNVDALIPDAARARHALHRANYWEHPATRPMGQGLTLLARRKDGSEFPVEISLSPVRAEEGFRVTAIIRDVTERKTSEEKIRAANQQLEIRNKEIERADRLKSEFLASMSHELRTPLHTIIGFAELLGEELEGPLNEKQKRFLNHVHQDSLHLLDLINDILDLSKIEAGSMQLHPESFDARDVVRMAVDGVRNLAAAKSITVGNHVESETFVIADRVRFREILSNLLSNAVKFTPEGGRVDVDLGPSQDGKVVFRVSDTGVGIAPEDHQAIFDKFRQVGAATHGVREGTGLGLAIVKHLVEMHGGSIWLESTVGTGSCFSFSIPADVSRPAAGPLVLVIEDEPSARELLSSYLNPLGIRTECAGNAEEGIAMARRLRPDAITVDLLLPGASGWHVLRELRSMPETTDTPVFVVSVVDEYHSAIDRGATAYLQKPLKKEALVRALRRHAPARFGMI
jgi:PAS domain S-box-containing protein